MKIAVLSVGGEPVASVQVTSEEIISLVKEMLKSVYPGERVTIKVKEKGGQQ